MSFSKSQCAWRFAFCKCGLIECNQIITKGNIVVKIHINVATIDQFIFIIINYRHSKIKKQNRKEKCRPGLVFSQLHLGSVLGSSTSILMYCIYILRSACGGSGQLWPRRARLGPSRPSSSRARRARNLVCELNELLARQLKIELTCASGTTSTYNCIQ